MNFDLDGTWGAFLLFFIPSFIAYIFFLLEQQRTLLAVDVSNRTISTRDIWVQLIPLFNLVWQFTVVKGIADSLRNEFESRNKASTIGIWDEGITDEVNIHPTYATGRWYCILACITAIPYIGFVTVLFVFIIWITYWGQLIKYRKLVSM